MDKIQEILLTLSFEELHNLSVMVLNELDDHRHDGDRDALELTTKQNIEAYKSTEEYMKKTTEIIREDILMFLRGRSVFQDDKLRENCALLNQIVEFCSDDWSEDRIIESLHVLVDEQKIVLEDGLYQLK